MVDAKNDSAILLVSAFPAILDSVTLFSESIVMVISKAPVPGAPSGITKETLLAMLALDAIEFPVNGTVRSKTIWLVARFTTFTFADQVPVTSTGPSFFSIQPRVTVSLERADKGGATDSTIRSES